MTRFRRILRLFAGFVVVLLLVVAFLPALLSTGFGRDRLLALVNDRVEGRIEASELDLGWFSSPALRGVALRDPDGEPVADIDGISVGATLLALVTGDLDLGAVQLDGVKLDLRRDAAGRLNLVRALAAVEPEPPDDRTLREQMDEFSLPGGFAVALEAKDARITYREPGAPDLVAGGVAVKLALGAPGEPAQLELSGTVARPGSIDASFRLRATLAGLVDGRLDRTKTRVTIGLDSSWGSQGELGARLTRLVGPALDLSIEASLDADGADVSLRAEAERARLTGAGNASFLAAPAEQLWRLTQPLELGYTVAPETFPAGDVTLDAPVRATLTVGKLEAPLAVEDPARVRFDAALLIEDGRAQVAVGERSESFAWRGWRATAVSPSLVEAVKVQVGGRISKDGDQGVVALDARATRLYDEPRIDAEARLQRFPLRPLDRLLSAVAGIDGLLEEGLGPVLDLSAVARTEGDRIDVTLRANSEQLELYAPVVLDGATKLATSKKIVLDYKLPPAVAWRYFGERVNHQLAADLPIHVELSELQLPFDAFDPARVTFRIETAAGPGRVEGARPLELERLSTSIGASSLSGPIQVRTRGTLVVGGRSGELRIDGVVRDLFGDGFTPDRAGGEVSLEVRDAPIGAVGGERGVAALGPRLDLKALLRATAGRAEIDLTANAEHLEVNLPLAIGDRFALRSPGRVTWRATPEFVRAVAGPDGPALARPAAVTLALPLFDLPLPYDPEAARVRVALTVGDGTLRQPTGADIVAWRDVSLALDGSLASLATKLAATLSPAPGSEVHRGLGGRVAILAQGDVAVDGDGRPASPRFEIGAGSERFDLRAAFRLGDHLELLEPLDLGYTLTPELLETLAEPARLSIRLESAQLPLAPFDWRAARARGTLGLTTTRFRPEGDLNDLALRDLAATARLESERIQLDLTATAAAGEVAAPLSLVLRAAADGSDGNARLRLERLPMALLDAFAGGGDTLRGLIGESIDLEAIVELPAGDAPGTATLAARAPQLTIDAALELGEAITLARPAVARWTVAPRPLGESLRLAQPATVDLRLDGVARDAAGSVTILGSLEAGRVTLADANRGASLLLDGLRVGIDVRTEGERAVFELAGTVPHGKEKGTLAGTVTLDGFDPERMLVSADVKLDALPVAPVDRLLDLEQLLPALFGARLTASVTARIRQGSGPIGFDVASENAAMKLRALLGSRFVTLSAPVDAQITFNEELGAFVLPKLGPLFQGVESTEQPVRFQVDPRGFRIDRDDPSLQTLVAPMVRVDVGKVVLRNKWLIQTIKQIAKSELQDRTTAWFTPLEMEMNGGVIRYRKRMDLLIENRLHLCNWGTVDLARDRLDMTVALMPRALRTYLDLDHARDGDTFQMELGGPVANPRIDIPRATANVAKLVAQEQLVKEAERRNVLLGRVAERTLRRIFQQVLGGKPVPPATVNPLPWDAR